MTDKQISTQGIVGLSPMIALILDLSLETIHLPLQQPGPEMKNCCLLWPWLIQSFTIFLTEWRGSVTRSSLGEGQLIHLRVAFNVRAGSSVGIDERLATSNPSAAPSSRYQNKAVWIEDRPWRRYIGIANFRGLVDSGHKTFTQMSPVDFENILTLIGGMISKTSHVLKEIYIRSR